MNEISAREYGKLETDVKHLSNQMIMMQNDLRCIRNMLEQSKGGWRMMMLVGGAGASLAAGIAWLITYFGVK